MSLQPYKFEEYMPRLLSEDELKDPEHIFISFFESFDLKDTREQLKEALELVVKKRFQHREYSIEEDNVRFFFEKVEKVIEAAWMMKS